MEDSFKARVEKVFGSLQHIPEPSPVGSSPWFLTDFPVERKDWKKGRDEDAYDAPIANRDEFPCSSSFDCSNTHRAPRCRTAFESEGEIDESDVGNHACDDDWSIRSSIGMDRTLDNEEEEDEYDRVAEGKEVAQSADSFRVRDPRANRSAANVRLQEDWAEGQHLNAQTSDGSLINGQLLQPARELRPILKRKVVDSTTKSSKRVKFDSGCKFSSVDDSPEASSVAFFTTNNNVPDYLCNPSRYTRYSFDTSDEMDEKSNSEAYLSFLSMVKGSKAEQMEDSEGDSLKSVTFIPRKKGEPKEDEVVHCTDDGDQFRQGPISGVSFEEESVQNDDTVMEENEETVVPDKDGRKVSRKYRNKSCYDEVE